MDIEIIINEFDITNEEKFNEFKSYLNEMKKRINELKNKSDITIAEEEELIKLSNQYWQIIECVSILVSERVDSMDNEELQQFRKFAVNRKLEARDFLLTTNSVSNSHEESQREIDLVSEGSLEDEEVKDLVTKWLKMYYVNKLGSYPYVEHLKGDVFQPEYKVKYLNDNEKEVGEFPVSSQDIPSVIGIESDTIDVYHKYVRGFISFNLPESLKGIKKKIFSTYGVEKEIIDNDNVFGNIGELTSDSIYISTGYVKPDEYTIGKLDEIVKETREAVNTEMGSKQAQFTLDKMKPLVDGNMDLLQLVDMHSDKISNAGVLRDRIVNLQDQINNLNGKLIKNQDIKNQINIFRRRLSVLKSVVVQQIKDWYIKNQDIKCVELEGKGENLFNSVENIESYLNSRNDLLISLDEVEAAIVEMKKRVQNLSERRQRDLDYVQEKGTKSLEKSNLTEQEKEQLVEYTMEQAQHYETHKFLSNRLPKIIEQKNIRSLVERRVENIHKEKQLSQMLSDDDMIKDNESLNNASVFSMNN